MSALQKIFAWKKSSPSRVSYYPIVEYVWIVFSREYATYDSVRGVYHLFCATYRFFCGVYGIVRGVFGISVNSATIASGKCHFYKAKQAILTFKTGTFPVLKWLRSNTTETRYIFFTLRSANSWPKIWISLKNFVSLQSNETGQENISVTLWRYDTRNFKPYAYRAPTHTYNKYRRYA